jgi:serine/threonine protein kinase
MEDLSGKQLGPYQIVSRLGIGGMATVFKAYQPRMDRNVALKVLPRHFSKNPEFIHRFSLEARLIAKLEHPHILPVYDFGESDGYTYLSMRLVRGGSLSNLLQKHGKLELTKINCIISQAGEALDYAHKAGVIHRDFKPSNVLIDKFDNCLLTDFGIAKLIEMTSHLTHTGGILGTPTYISPEQGSGELIDNRSDIYSLGVVLYQMVVGDVPYKADTPMAVIFKHIHDPLPLPRQKVPDLPEPVERVILKALAKNPDDRYSTAFDLVNALQGAIDQPTAPIQEVQEPDLDLEPTEVVRETISEPPEEPRPEIVKPKVVEEKKTLPRRVWVYGVLVIFLLAIFAGSGWYYYNNIIISEPILKVNSNPSGADVYVDGGHVGVSPVQVEELKPGTHKILISKDRYQDYEEDLFIQKGKPRIIQAKLAPKPFGDLEVNSNPSRAEVIIDDDKRGITPIAIKDLPKGTHRVMVKKEGFDPWQDTIEIISLEKAQISANLVTIYGGLNISSSPSEADVYVDGKKEGKTPLVLKKIKKGNRNLVIKKIGFDVWKGEVAVKSSEVSQVRVNLVTIYGKLNVTSNPSGAIVYIDAKKVGKTPLAIKEIQKGLRILKLKKDDFDVWEKDVYIKAAEVSKIKVDLAPSYRALEVPSTPHDAKAKAEADAKDKAEQEAKAKAIQRLQVQPDPRLAVAIFPSNTTQNDEIWCSMVHADIIRAAFETVTNKPEVVLRFSSYKGKFYSDVEIIDTLFDEKARNKLWEKKSFFRHSEPDVSNVMEFAKKTEADLILMYRYGWSYYVDVIDKISVYLIDTKTAKIYTASKTTSADFADSAVEEITNKVLDDFLSED